MLKQRLITAAIGILLVFCLIESGSALTWHLAVWVISLLGMVEFSSMFGHLWKSQLCLLGLVVVTLIEWFPKVPVGVAVYIVIGLAMLWPVIRKNVITIKDTATIALGAGYIGYGGVCIFDLRILNHGTMWVWLCLICIWATDTAAYFVGKRLGGVKLWSSISPHKTLSGAIGGIVGASVVALSFGYLLIPHFDPFAYMITGAVVSIAGQLGDLAESAYKRAAGVKDSGKLLPGHGGILDRVDSLLFAAPFAFYLITTGMPTWFQ